MKELSLKTFEKRKDWIFSSCPFVGEILVAFPHFSFPKQVISCTYTFICLHCIYAFIKSV